MALRSVYRKTERTPEELASLRADRERFQRERPGLDDLIASGEYEGPYRQSDILELLELLAGLREARSRAGLTLDQVSALSGIDKAALSRLENGKSLNPTFETLSRYASALGERLTLGHEAVPCG
jgi:DNA-binding XRE family transcriptional regulator